MLSAAVVIGALRVNSNVRSKGVKLSDASRIKTELSFFAKKKNEELLHCENSSNFIQQKNGSILDFMCTTRSSTNPSLPNS